MPGCEAPSGQAGVALEPGFVRQEEGGTGLWEEERSGVYRKAVGLLGERREQGKGQRISYFAVTVTEQQEQGDLKKKAFNWLTVSEG